VSPIHFDDTPIFRAFSYSNNIPGWMDSLELTWLYLVAQEMDSIVEIGSWKGKSTDALLAGCGGTVWTVDHFRGSLGESLASWAKTKDIFKIFMDNVGHYENLKVLKMDSIEASKKFRDYSVDMVFIDGAHSYKAVKADIKAWLPKAKKMICGHDFDFPDVHKAVEEKFGKVNKCQSLWIKEIL